MKIISRSFGWFKGPKSLFILLLLFLTTSGMRRCRWDKWSIQNFQPPTFRKLELPTNFLDSRLPTSLWQPPADVRFIFFSCQRPSEISSYQSTFEISTYQRPAEDILPTSSEYLFSWWRRLEISANRNPSEISAYERPSENLPTFKKNAKIFLF